eukprot:gene1640-12765_t
MTIEEFSSFAVHHPKSVCWIQNDSIVTGSYDECDNSLLIWEKKENKLINTPLIKHEGESFDLKVNNNNIYSASSNGNVYKYCKSKTGEYKVQDSYSNCHNGTTTSIDFGQSSLITAGEDGYVNIFDSKNVKNKIKADSLPIHCVRFSGSSTNSKFLTTSSSVKIWDSNQSNTKEIHQLTNFSDSNSILSAQIHPSQPEKVITSGVSGIVSMWDTRKTKAPIFSSKPSNSIIWKIQFIPNQQNKVVMCNEDGELIYWKHENLNEKDFFIKECSSFGINSFDISGQHIAYICDDGKVSISKLE